MRIALLNLPFDNNYGGNLQRYALIKVLESMGHEVYHIDIQSYHHLKWYIKPYSYFKRFIQRIFLNKDVKIFLEENLNENNRARNELARLFYEKYIPHTDKVTNKGELKRLVSNNYDAVMVGSDQVWRESMTKQMGIDCYFLSFVKEKRIKKIAYAVSMGTENERFSEKNMNKLAILYSQFDAVSVREMFSLNVLKQYGWIKPPASLVLDPTLLLEPSDYDSIMDNETTDNDNSHIFCYLLDRPANFSERMDSLCERYQTTYDVQTLTEKKTIEKWLSDIWNARLVVTDSYHGCVFSILFNRPFLFIGNERRGNARVSSLFDLLGINKDSTDNLNYEEINTRIKSFKKQSLAFLEENLK